MGKPEREGGTLDGQRAARQGAAAGESQHGHHLQLFSISLRVTNTCMLHATSTAAATPARAAACEGFLESASR